MQTLYNIAPNQLLTVIEGLYVLGDMDGNTVLDAFDVSAFELALADPADYALRYPGLERRPWRAGSCRNLAACSAC